MAFGSKERQIEAIGFWLLLNCQVARMLIFRNKIV